MPTSPSSPDRPQPPSRPTPRWKDAVIAVLALLLVAISAVAFKDKLGGAGSWFKAKPKGEAVAVFNVVMDRKSRSYVDILFDHPLGQGKQGEVLDPAPAKIEPSLGGYWKWQDTNALRFQPTSRFPVASEFKITLLPERILKPGQELAGDRELKVVTDRFLVEGVDVLEEPAITGKAKVIFRGTLKFNYDVKPEELAPRIKLVDPEAPDGKPIVVDLEANYEEKAIGFHTEAVQKKKEERKVRLVVGGELTSAAGNVPLGDDYVHEIPVGSAEKLAVWGVTSEPGDHESTLKVRFSSPVSAAVAEKYVHIAPAVPVRPSAERNLLSLTGELKPGGTYTLTIDKGMPATDDAVLQAAYKTEVNLPDLEPSVDFQSQGTFLSAAGHHTVAIESVNVAQAKLTVDRVYLNNLFFLFQYGGFFDEDYAWEGSRIPRHLGSRLGEETLTLANRKNRKQLTPVTLDDHLGDTPGATAGSKRGLYRVVVSREGEPKGSQRWLLLTDLGVVAKRGNGELLVWVSSFRDLAAIADAKVTLISEQNQTLASGRTDGDGVWRVKDSEALKAGEREARPYMLTVEKGDDFTFLLFDRMKIDPTGLDVGGAASQASGYSAFLYGERDIYRPGERVVGLAVVRDEHLKAPPRMPLVLRWRDPQGRERGTQKVTADERGLADFHLDLPAFALTGGHTLELLAGEETIGQYRFQVEEFVPDRIRVEIAKPTGPVGPGQALAYSVASSYLFGPPAAGLAVETRVRVVDSTFAPKGFDGFTFRNAERKLDDKEIFSQQGALDAAGRKAFTATVPSG
ncbi:MAG TPA: MG2 domain-containing protein, partial [Thermoanaerobaculia bacterium]